MIRIRPALAFPLTMVAAAIVSATAAVYAAGQNDVTGLPGERRATYAIGLWGDLPYSTEQANPGVPHLIADMNAQKLAFTAHDGDASQRVPATSRLA